jgi:hypothetical protein
MHINLMRLPSLATEFLWYIVAALNILIYCVSSCTSAPAEHHFLSSEHFLIVAKMQIPTHLLLLPFGCSVAYSAALGAKSAALGTKSAALGANDYSNPWASSDISVEAQCAEIDDLTQLVQMATNQTLMNGKVTNDNLDVFEAAALFAAAANASTKLTGLSSNATLVAHCAIVNAHKQLATTCDQMTALQKWANTTVVDEVGAQQNLSQSQVSFLKSKAADANTELNALQSNSSLVADCQQLLASETGTASQCEWGVGGDPCFPSYKHRRRNSRRLGQYFQ